MTLRKYKTKEERIAKLREYIEGDKNPAKRPEVRKILSQQKMGSKNPMYGKHPSEETIKKLKEKNNHYWLGKHRPKETIEKMRKAGKNLWKDSEYKKHMSEVHQGQNAWNKGIRNEKQSKSWLGEGNPNYKGGISPLITMIRGLFEYRQWRSDVFTRDNFTCQKCRSKVGGIFNAHHKASLTVLVRQYNIKTTIDAVSCAGLWNINNGITLCKNCHIDFHKKYGKSNNTPEQLEQFLSERI